MEINRQIQNYQYFFDDQVREAEVEQKTKVKSPINQLLQKEELSIGYVDHVNVDRGHVVLRFLKDRGPRLKIQKSIVVIKKAAWSELGEKYSEWNCSFWEFFKNETYHSSSSDLVPLYYLHKNDSKYDYVGCSSVNLSLFDFMKEQTSKGKILTVLVYTPFPPVDYFKNLNSYMEMFPENSELLLEPKIDYEDWHPIELAYDPNNKSYIADTIIKTLEDDAISILQGSPGSGKSYTIAQILKCYLNEGKTACVTTMANKGLIELVQQPPLEEILKEERIAKTNLTADEKRIVKSLKPSVNGLFAPKGELICSTNYVLSHAFGKKNVEEHGLPSYDLIVIEEASQAFLTSIVAFKSLGCKCLIVGDPMQLPPIVTKLRKSVYRTWNVNRQIEGLKTFALGTDIKSYRITTTFRLTPKSAALTGLFYDNRFTSVQENRLDYSKSKLPYFPSDGGVLYCYTDDFTNGVFSRTSLAIMSDIVKDLETNYPKRSFAIISPFKDTVKQIQKMFLTDTKIGDITVETIDRIQGMTVDYAILYIPGRNPGFALDERRFNVATSRSRSTTLILSDIPLTNLHSVSARINEFLGKCKHILPTNDTFSIEEMSERDQIKYVYPGLENIVDLLLDKGVEFNHDGDCELTDINDVVLASAGMILRKYKIAIDPIDKESKRIFEENGYKTIDSSDFSIDMIK